jgi:hypothetical protein
MKMSPHTYTCSSITWGCFYLEHYQGIDKFATYALESKHSENKRVVNSATNNKALHMEQRFQLDSSSSSSYRHRSGTTSTTCKINERKKKAQHQVTISQWQKRAWAVNQGGELTHPQWAEASLAIAAKYKDYIVSSDQNIINQKKSL